MGLILRRAVGETICIGDDIRVTVVDVRCGKVGIDVKAPRSVAVHRSEVADAIKADAQREATAVALAVTGKAKASSALADAAPAKL